MLAQNKKAAEEKLQKENRRQLSELSKQPGNNICCDCTAQRPSWASTNLGIFICLRCAGIHRSLGSHISFVRSITMDDWTPKQMETMFAIGNVKSTQYYERNKPADKKKPTEFDGVDLLRNHITDKYVMRKFVDKTVSSPSELLEKARLEKEKQKKATKSSSSKLSLNTTDARMKKEELQAKKLKEEQLKKKKAAAAAKHESEDEEESDDSEDDDFKSSKKVKKPEKKRSTALLSFDFSDGIESVSPTVGDAKDAKSSGEDENESGDDDFGSKTKKKTKSKRVNNKDEEEEEVKKTKKTSTKKSKKSSDADESEGKKKKKKVSCKSSKISSGGSADHTTNGSQDTAESTYDFLLHDEQPQSKSSAASVKDLTDFLGDLTIDDAPPKPLSIEEFEQQLKMNLMFDMKTAPAVQTPDEDALAAPLIASPAINPSNLSVQKDELVNNEGRSRSASLVSLGDEVNEDRVAVMSNEHDQDSDEDQMDFSSDSDDDFSSSKKKKTKVVQEEEKPKKKKKSSDDSSTTKKKKSVKKKSKEDTEADGEKKKKKKKKETSDD